MSRDYQAMKAAGLCVRCGVKASAIRCPSCAVAEAKRIKAWRKKRRKAGKCVDCGVRCSKSRCASCAAVSNTHDKRRKTTSEQRAEKRRLALIERARIAEAKLAEQARRCQEQERKVEPTRQMAFRRKWGRVQWIGTTAVYVPMHEISSDDESAKAHRARHRAKQLRRFYERNGIVPLTTFTPEQLAEDKRDELDMLSWMALSRRAL